MHMCVCLPAIVHVEDRGWHWVSAITLYCLGQSSHWDWETSSAPPELQMCSPMPDFSVGAGIWSQVFMLTQQALYPLSLSPALYTYISFFKSKLSVSLWKKLRLNHFTINSPGMQYIQVTGHLVMTAILYSLTQMTVPVLMLLLLLFDFCLLFSSSQADI